jgi:hypothetical protein
MTRPIRPSRALAKARAAIERYGWVRGKFGDKSCGFCAAGAIGCVAPTYTEQWRDLMNVLMLFERLDGNWTAGWNDAPERTREEVLAAFTSAIAIAESIEAYESAVSR